MRDASDQLMRRSPRTKTTKIQLSFASGLSVVSDVTELMAAQSRPRDLTLKG